MLTMLAPHHRKNSQLGEIRFASENFFDAAKFLRRQAMLGHNFRRDLGIESGVRHRSTKISETARALKSRIIFVTAVARRGFSTWPSPQQKRLPYHKMLDIFALYVPKWSDSAKSRLINLI